MDPRLELDPARALGLEEGDAHVVRNAGGRVTDALRSIIISQQLLGTREIIIVHHNVDHIAFLPFGDLKQSVLDDVKLLKENPLVLDVLITGYLYEVETGKILKV
ncbi:carbonic anhydrase [Penicillium maclennaniae]|uniref:carbonic anhydrase n=1 Tax=Penicillium maclennaniae TaxID=1343394 RepID=UPI002540DEA5|nr:carbonic anhydrase [Penicillium maclennaniae]KAJ5662221.1 carbonic anhydrase [Penicillium maclennaniae]